MRHADPLVGLYLPRVIGDAGTCAKDLPVGFTGFVTASLSLDGAGNVTRVQVEEASANMDAALLECVTRTLPSTFAFGCTGGADSKVWTKFALFALE
jgi:hypothetical protein